MGLLEIIALILVIMWIGGFALHIAGNLIHILLVVAVIVFLLRFIRSNA
ncbi:MAG TPA: lmo0937 family membrane protein [Candidatus Saccharimonadales bacterium]|nr:lmo0937 family membrane protein [Candidatus Saccharimonadales bacterium]